MWNENIISATREFNIRCNEPESQKKEKQINLYSSKQKQGKKKRSEISNVINQYVIHKVE